MLILGALPSEAQQQVSFAPASAGSTADAAMPDSIPATLSLPPSVTRSVPAVVIVHASAGLLPNGPEPRYVAALNAAGIATLVIDMWAARGIPVGPEAFGGTGGPDRRPRLPRDTLPDAFGALKFLAANPAIDARRIGILGFSWGAAVSVLAAVETNAARALGPAPRFAAHAGHYLVCWPYLPGGPGANVFTARWTGAPLQLQVAGRDDYDADGGASCARLVEALPPETRAHVSLVLHEKATHAWDVELPSPMTFEDRYSHRGAGGPVEMTYDRSVTESAVAATVGFFKDAFARNR
jgi:dienelactone hydrolase